jgi:hypothetical protein
MTDQHPITPPSELLQQWATEYWGNPGESIGCGEKYIAIKAAQWGADQELEACIQLLDINGCPGKWIDMLRAARRPKPPSLKEQALEQMEALESHGAALCNLGVLRRALEALDD